MRSTYLLVHPPLLGPAVWEPVARVLAAAGHRALVPDLRAATDPPEDWWDRAADAAVAAAAGEHPVVVGHSGAGVLLPLVADRLAGVRAVVLVDAVLPARSGPTAPSAGLRACLDGLPTEDGLLPRWTRWWPAETVAGLLPDEAYRARLEEEQPRLARRFYDVAVPVPDGWPAARVGYLRLSPAYDDAAAEAADRGWPVDRVDGHHLTLVTDPAGVAGRIAALAGRPEPV